MNGRKKPSLPNSGTNKWKSEKEISPNCVPFQNCRLFKNAKLSYLIEKGV